MAANQYSQQSIDLWQSVWQKVRNSPGSEEWQTEERQGDLEAEIDIQKAPDVNSDI